MSVHKILTGDNEWYTPKKYIDSARIVLGSIDLDPASNDNAQSIIQADKYFTIKTNGLDKKWTGNVWLNPPYGRGLINKFVNKALEEYLNSLSLLHGKINMIILVNSCPDTSWYHNLLNHCSAFCITRGRIKFEKIDGAKASPPSGQTFFYFGDNYVKFHQEFKQYGFIIHSNQTNSLGK